MRVLVLRSLEAIRDELKKIGVDSGCIDSLAAKGMFITVKVEHLNPASCNIIKQSALSVGTDAAVHREVITGRKDDSDIILFGSYKEIERVAGKLRGQPFGLDSIAEELLAQVNGVRKPRQLKTSMRSLTLGDGALLMGVLNVTPDSFSDGGKFLERERAVERALKMEEEGADIIDIGGESSRPGSDPVSEREEMERVIPVIEAVKKESTVAVSIDTYKSVVAERALKCGAEMVNDVSALRFDVGMVEVIREYSAAVVLMHMQGTPKMMQDDPRYDDVIQEICDFLRERADYAITHGIPRESVAIDPGIGFGKRLQENYEILDRVAEFASLGFPVLVGASRKSFIGKTLEREVDERIEGSLAACAAALDGGVDIMRVHDVGETKRFVKMYECIRRERG
jgi:dihydropteroate synthase